MNRMTRPPRTRAAGAAISNTGPRSSIVSTAHDAGRANQPVPKSQAPNGVPWSWTDIAKRTASPESQMSFHLESPAAR